MSTLVPEPRPSLPATSAPPLLAVVDDDAAFRRLVRNVAEPLGWRLSEYESGAAFLRDHPKTQAPDLALLDLFMPDKDGIETLPELTRRFPACRIVIATGSVPSVAEAAHLIGQATSQSEVQVLAKPASLADLRAAIGPASAAP